MATVKLPFTTSQEKDLNISKKYTVDNASSYGLIDLLASTCLVNVTSISVIRAPYDGLHYSPHK